MSQYFNNIIYGVHSFVTGLKVTWDHFINKKALVATLQYPHEKWPVPERNIGFDHSEYNLIRSRLHVDINDCIACMQCERACPVDCIKIDAIKPSKDSDVNCGITSNDTQKKMIVSRFTIDMSECMYCNLCVYPCPEECIYMAGGPNDKKHEIDYEFSQYKRDGLIFEFADASDDAIRDAGGGKWLEQRDAKLKKNSEGIELMGVVQEASPTPAAKPLVETKTESEKLAANTQPVSDELEITSFNVIADKMCRGIAKKTFMTAKRADKDTTAILADVAQVLSDSGKMTGDIQSILDRLSVSPAETAETATDIVDTVKTITPVTADPVEEVKEFDIKDLNAIEDKMVRGTAKKALLAAKRSGVDRVEAVRKALIDAGKLDSIAEEVLNLFSVFTKEPSEPVDTGKPTEANKEVPVDSSAASDPIADLSLFEISALDCIDDKMTRGMAKKIYMAGKRAGKTRAEVIADIKIGLTESGKLEDITAGLLNNLESGN